MHLTANMAAHRGQPEPAAGESGHTVAPSHRAREIRIETGDVGRRIDVVLSRRLGMSRRKVQQWLARGDIRQRGGPSRLAKGSRLTEGQVLLVECDQPLRVIPEPETPLDVLAVADGCIVVDKPAGVCVHPLDPAEGGTVLNAVVGHFPSVEGVGEGGLRSGLVHRLDRDTSGALLIATHQERWRILWRAIRAGRAQKLYRAIVRGHLAGRRREEMDLVTACHRPARVRVVSTATRARHRGMRRCSLTWRTVETLRHATLVEVRLETGFLHQIRVMLAHLGHPVLGDRVYADSPDTTRGASGCLPQPRRQMLHASVLRIDGFSAVSPDPMDFVDTLIRLRGVK